MPEPAVPEDPKRTSRQRPSDQLGPASVVHFCRERVDLPDEPQHEAKDQLRNDHGRFGHPPSERNHNACPGSSASVDVIGVPAGLQHELQIRAGFEESTVQLRSFPKSQQDLDLLQQSLILRLDRMMQDLNFRQLSKMCHGRSCGKLALIIIQNDHVKFAHVSR